MTSFPEGTKARAAACAFKKACILGATAPVWWIEAIFRLHLHRRQKDVVDAVWSHDRVAVKSGHGVGKGTVSACIALWWVIVRRGLVLVTAPTWAQVTNVWFATLRKVFESGVFPPARTPAFQVRTHSWMLGPSWGILGISSDRPDNVQGYHAERLLLIADEAAGIDDALFEAFEGAQVSRGVGKAGMLLLGNPVRSDGYFAEAFAPSSSWKTLTIPCTDSPNVTGERRVPGLATLDWIEERRAEWGPDSNAFRVRVMGEFPLAGSADRVIPEDVLRKAIATAAPAGVLSGVVQGLDVARFGDDASVSVILRDGVVADASAVHGMGAVQVARWAEERAALYGACITVVDETGVGGGVVDEMRRLRSNVRGVNFASAPAQRDRWRDIRTELAFNVASALASGALVIPPTAPHELFEDLRSLHYGITVGGALQVEPKDAQRRRLRRSPDWADAFFLAWRGYSRLSPPHSEDKARRALRSAVRRFGPGHIGGVF
ncbi:MAG: hypothetical protein JW909_13065 [Planctomycetes bacterium]|nr:hypothetical protein [Planctomycetota bacterium]